MRTSVLSMVMTVGWGLVVSQRVLDSRSLIVPLEVSGFLRRAECLVCSKVAERSLISAIFLSRVSRRAERSESWVVAAGAGVCSLFWAKEEAGARRRARAME